MDENHTLILISLTAVLSVHTCAMNMATALSYYLYKPLQTSYIAIDQVAIRSLSPILLQIMQPLTACAYLHYHTMHPSIGVYSTSLSKVNI